MGQNCCEQPEQGQHQRQAQNDLHRVHRPSLPPRQILGAGIDEPLQLMAKGHGLKGLTRKHGQVLGNRTERQRREEGQPAHDDNDAQQQADE